MYPSKFVRLLCSRTQSHYSCFSCCHHICKLKWCICYWYKRQILWTNVRSAADIPKSATFDSTKGQFWGLRLLTTIASKSRVYWRLLTNEKCFHYSYINLFSYKTFEGNWKFDRNGVVERYSDMYSVWNVTRVGMSRISPLVSHCLKGEQHIYGWVKFVFLWRSLATAVSSIFIQRNKALYYKMVTPFYGQLDPWYQNGNASTSSFSPKF